MKGRKITIHFRAWLLALAALILLSSCAHKDLVRKNYVNVRDEFPLASRSDNAKLRASADANMLDSTGLPTSDKKFRPFLGVAISGGGSRAANFGLYVLEELDRLGILDRIDAISSVSGGSIEAAHFGLYYPQLRGAYWKRAEEDLRQDFRDDWLLRHADPANWRTLYQNDFNASTILAETYDDMLFHGATFRNFGAPGPGRPHILLNATAIRNPDGFRRECIAQGENADDNGLGTFVFTSGAFTECLGSRIGTYSIAQAVAASSAYPGLFSPVNLEAYPGVNNVGQRHKEYLHLIDGGIADNLGVDALVAAANQRRLAGLVADDAGGTRRTLDDDVPCFLIVVDAHIDGGEKLENQYADLRHTLFDRTIDPSWSYAFDGLLQRRRYDTLLSLGIDTNKYIKNYDYVRSTDRHTIPLRENRGYTQRHVGNFVLPIANSSDLMCATWHISLRDVFWLGSDQSDVLRDNESLNRRASVNAIVTNADTDLKLTGGVDCAPMQYQAALSDAAKILVREDASSMSILHAWLVTHDVPTPGSWQADPYGTNGRKFRVTGASKGPLGSPSGRIRCLDSASSKESSPMQ